MKKYILILVSLFSLAGCSLKEELMSSSRSEDFYTNAAQCQTGINACYNLIRSQLGGQNFWFVTDGQTDCMIMNASKFYNATLNFSPSRPAIASTIWKYSYMGVMRANAMIAAIENCRQKGGCTEAEAREMTCETIVLRAFFYYLLTCTFGDVPFYTDVVTEENRDRIASLPRMSANDTRDYLINELLEIALPVNMGGRGLMPLKRSYDQPVNNRMNGAIALMIAAKMALWNERWDDAVRAVSALETGCGYGEFAANPEAFGKTYPLTDIPFSRKYTPESILEISNTFEPYGVQQTGYIAVVSTPSKGRSTVEGEEEEDYEITDIYGGMAIPELGTTARISTSARPTTWYFETVLSYDSPDLRGGEYSADAETARGGSGNLAWRWSGFDRDDTERLPENRSVRWFKSGSSATASTFNKLSRPWLGNKFWCPGMYYTLDSNNPKFFRFADALLMKSEAYLRLGNVDQAAAYLNITRVRAGLDKISMASVGGNEEAFMEEIRLERARELFGEFQRKFDLVRWGIWYERTLQYNDGMYLPDFIRPFHRYLPIPAEQITYSHGALDNNEYME